MLTLIVDRTTQTPVQSIAAFTDYEAGYNAYQNQRGPGLGRLRAFGWLQAHKDEQATIAAESAQLADERLDANDRHYQWQY
jgi:hypothetical protein